MSELDRMIARQQAKAAEAYKAQGAAGATGTAPKRPHAHAGGDAARAPVVPGNR